MFEEQIMKGFSALGLRTELVRADPLDVLGLPVYRVDLYDLGKATRFGGMRFWGKGLTSDIARLSAVAEAVERCSAYEHSGASVLRASYHELGKTALDPQLFLPTAPELLPLNRRLSYNPDRPIEWVEGYKYKFDKVVYIPAALAFLYPPCKDGLISTTSSGIAAGKDYTAAILHALCEIVERDATMIMMRNRMVRPMIEPPQSLLQSIEHMRVQGMQVLLRNIATDIEIPSIVALIRDEQERFPVITYGFGVHPDFETACIRAITEAAQSRVIEIFNWRNFKVKQFKKEELKIIFEHLLTWAPSQSQTGSLIDGECSTEEMTTAVLAAIHKALPCSDLYVVKLTMPEFEIPVVRVLMPGLIPPQANYPLVFRRLLTVPRKLSYTDRDVTVDELWKGTWPH